jgi:beta-aspartyl-peptidase (threonine type)
MNAAQAQATGYVIALHGGVGVLPRERLTPELDAAYREALGTALEAARQSLEQGGSALDAVVAAIITMEDSPLFNAGKGSVFTSAGTHELDAALMNGEDLRAGAVAAVTTIKNPIVLARAVMDQSPHVMLIGAGAEAFAREQGIEQVGPEYFYTERRWQELQKAKAEAEKAGGTVGVVVLDSKGHLAAGTSTGGRTNKRWGRVGDSPVIGAGTYAEDSSCAVSATGDGEYFIRLAVAHEIRALVKYGGRTLQEAADQVILQSLPALGGTGGVVAIDPHGAAVFSFNTEGMYRGLLRQGGEPEVAIYRETMRR